MAYGPSYRVAFRRRREGKTDYQQRRSLVISGLPRMVVRGSLRSVSVQLAKAEVGGDKILVSATSKELAKNYGWQGGRGNLPAAYLTGLICGYKAVAGGVKEAVLDLGLRAPTKGSLVFATLKGILDAGVAVPHDEKKLPDEKRVQGQHISDYAKQLAATPEVYQRRFAEQLSKGLRPEETVQHFAQVKEKISSAFQKPEEIKEKEKEEPPKPSEEKAEAVKKPRKKAAATAEKPVKPRTRKPKQPRISKKTEEKK
jgi:large subunit ribosomal protein L18